jgi:hypothetical protein
VAFCSPQALDKPHQSKQPTVKQPTASHIIDQQVTATASHIIDQQVTATASHIIDQQVTATASHIIDQQVTATASHIIIDQQVIATASHIIIDQQVTATTSHIIISKRSATTPPGSPRGVFCFPRLRVGRACCIRSRDARSKRFNKNITRIDAELRAECADYHERQPYAVMIAIICFPMAACQEFLRREPQAPSALP